VNAGQSQHVNANIQIFNKEKVGVKERKNKLYCIERKRYWRKVSKACPPLI